MFDMNFSNIFWPYLLNDFHQIFKHLPAFSYIFVGDDCSCKVPQDVWAHCLDGIQVPKKHKRQHTVVPSLVAITTDLDTISHFIPKNIFLTETHPHKMCQEIFNLLFNTILYCYKPCIKKYIQEANRAC